MTRGTFVLFTPEDIYLTTEFNGDMYFNGHGELAAMEMRNVHTSDELLSFAKAFNKKKFGYPEEEIRLYLASSWGFTYEDMLDMRKDYFKKYFSDYIYIANVSGHNLIFHTENGDRTLPNNTSGVLNFGQDATDFPPELDAFKDGGVRYRAAINPKEAITDIGETTGMQLSVEDAKEASNLMEQKGYRKIVMAYPNMAAYIQQTVIAKLENSLAAKYFDVDRYIREEKETLEEQGLYELKSGHVLMFAH